MSMEAHIGPDVPAGDTTSEAVYLEQIDRGHPLLRFSNGTLEEEFRDHYRRAGLRRLQVGLIAAFWINLLSAPLVTYFLYTPPELAYWYRITTLGLLTPVVFGSLVVSYFDRDVRVMPALALFDILFAAVVIVIQRNFYELHGARFPFASEEFITIVIFLFCGWRFFVALIVAIGTFATVAAVNLLLSENFVSVMQNVFNLVAIGILAGAAAFMTEHITRSNFLYNHVRSLRATRDGLTGLLNRRSFDEQLSMLWKEGAREGRPVAIMIADVDHFKAYNDTYGPLQGDAALKKVAEVLQQTVARRPLDIAARLGGEEFAVVWWDISAQSAAMLADRFREAIAEERMPHRGSPSGVLTVSCGYTVCVPASAGDTGDALKAADAALYQAKNLGRNRVAAA